MIGQIFIVVGTIIMLLSIICLLFSLTNYDLSPIYGIIGSCLGIVIGTIGCGLIADSGEKSQSQPQEFVGETTIVEVYDVNGELVKTYEGKFDIETNADGKYIIFDDENNKRHQIYYTTGTVCIEEK